MRIQIILPFCPKSCKFMLMKEAQDFSLLDKLKLRNTYQVVAEEGGKTVYAHTTYFELDEAEYENFITEDDEPVDSLFSELQQRLSIEPLKNSKIDWTDRDFMACANVGVYYAKKQPPVIPDMFLSMDVKRPKSWREKKDKCYFAWRMGKMPDLVLEIVSNKVGGEADAKLALYARLGVPYYVIHDPDLLLSKEELKVYRLVANEKYELIQEPYHYIPEINLGIQLWKGVFEEEDTLWHRWCTKEGTNLMTSKERSDEEKARADEEAKLKELEKARADEEKARADLETQLKEKEKIRADLEAKLKEKEKARADEEKKRADRLMEKLMALGLKPEEL